MSNTPPDRTADRTDAIVIRWLCPDDSAERLVFEPRVDGYYKRRQVWTGEKWRTLATEVVDEVEVER